MRPPPFNLNADDLIAWLGEVRDAIAELQQPTQPQPAYRTASTDLPPAASFTGCIIDLSDLPTLAKSDGSAWRRVDTGAAL